MKLDDWYEQQYPEHSRDSCSDAQPINADVDGSGCHRCNAILFTQHGEFKKDAEHWRQECKAAREMYYEAINQRDELLARIAEESAERDAVNTIAKRQSAILTRTGDELADCRTEIAALKAECDTRIAQLERQRDGLLAALERSLESFEYIAKYGNSCGHSQLRIPDLKAVIASVKEMK